MAYRYEDMVCSKSRFDVDALYVLHSESCRNLDFLKEQIRRQELCKKVHILHAATALSQADSYRNVFEHAKVQNYDLVLVVESHAHFKETGRGKDQGPINSFIKAHASESFVYQLGGIPFFMFPLNKETFRSFGLGACAGVYSASFRNLVLAQKSNVATWDGYLLTNTVSYTCVSPFFYPSFPFKENESFELSINGMMFLMKCVISLIPSEGKYELLCNLCYTLAKQSILLLIVLALMVAVLFVHNKKIYDFFFLHVTRFSFRGYTLQRILEKVNMKLMLPSAETAVRSDCDTSKALGP